jgi:pimeloyl-ACP methyl ester carboxylesterase
MARPRGRAAYTVRILADDVLGLLDAAGLERAHVVGHDWGAGVAWAMALLAPERVDKLVVLSVGHPGVQPTLEQREKSWYMLLFQFPEAEDILRRNDFALAREWLASHPDLDIEGFDLTPGLNWYRANLHPRGELERRSLPAVPADTMGIWSDGDAYLTENGMKRSGEHVTGSWRYERIDGAGHWMQLDAPERVNALLLDFLA